MSVETDSNTDRIYIRLLDEGTTVFRPTQGISLGYSVYKVLATADYDPEDECWEFQPGSIVRCVLELRDGEDVLIAREMVELDS